MDTQAAILAAMDKEPNLTNFGMNTHDRQKTAEQQQAEFEQAREALRNNLHQFELCCQWLSLCQPIHTINTTIGSSYALKHRVEDYFHEYVSNGAFIAAAIHLGITYRVNPGSPNVYVALSSKAIPEINPANQSVV